MACWTLDPLAADWAERKRRLIIGETVDITYVDDEDDDGLGHPTPLHLTRHDVEFPGQAWASS